jgi:hypothetical protein
MIATPQLFIPALLAATLLAAGCDAIFTGEKVVSIPVTASDAGGYGPVALTLTPDMAPVAINFRAEHGSDPAELGKWNTYRAALAKDGVEVAAAQFSLNQTGTSETPQGSPYLVEHMLTLYPAEAGAYELTITPSRPVEVRLGGTEVQVRRNVRNSGRAR